jgi:hypothetical protein
MSSAPMSSADPKEPTLLAAIWPETEQNRDYRSLAFVTVGALAIAGAATVVDAPGLIFGRSGLMLLFHPAVVSIYVVLIAVAFWPETSRMRFKHYVLIATVTAAAFGLLYAAQGWTYHWRVGYMLLATSILYLGIVAAGNLRVAVPLVVISAMAFVAVGLTQPDTPSNVVLNMNARLLIAGEMLVQGLVFAGAVEFGWGAPRSRMIAAIFLINLVQTIWVGLYYGRDSGRPLLIAGVVSAFGTAAATKLAWQYFTHPTYEYGTVTRLPD